jgi:type IV pilus assembly protein PilA
MKLVKNNKGVTLAELLAVITIMGIIAAIAIPAIGNVIRSSRIGAAESDAVAIYEAARVMCTVEDCTDTALTDGSGLDSTELGPYLEGSIEGTYQVGLAGGKAVDVTYDLDTAIDTGYDTVVYSPGSGYTWS